MFIVCNILIQCFISGIDFHHIFKIGTDRTKMESFSSMGNGKVLTPAKPSTSISKIKCIKHQEFHPYTTAAIKAKFKKCHTIGKGEKLYD